VAALVTDMFCNFYLVNNHKIAKNLTTTKAREKISAVYEYLDFEEFTNVYVCFTFLVKAGPKHLKGALA
jgi:hypothetical protein